MGCYNKESRTYDRETSAKIGGGVESESERIKDAFLKKGLESKIKGIREKAENGTGNYSFKNAEPIAFKGMLDIGKNTTVHTRGENTLVEGYTDSGKHVYYAGKTESDEIKALLEARKNRVDTTPNITDKLTTTTTYERWYQRNKRNMYEWHFGEKKK